MADLPADLTAWSPLPTFVERLAAYLPFACVPKSTGSPWLPTAEAVPLLLRWPDTWEARVSGRREDDGVVYLAVEGRDFRDRGAQWGAGFAAARASRVGPDGQLTPSARVR